MARSNKRNTKKRRGVIPVIIILALLAAAAYIGITYMRLHDAGEKSQAVLDQMKLIIPGLGTDTEGSVGAGRDPLVMITIDDKNIVGCLEVPSIDLMAPVTAEGEDEAGFATYVSGSPLKGELKLSGGREDVFRSLQDAKPGDMVAFTDVDGVRYRYRVTTQFHLKEWDEGDNDLMLCYDTDSHTEFVLGCSKDY